MGGEWISEKDASGLDEILRHYNQLRAQVFELSGEVYQHVHAENEDEQGHSDHGLLERVGVQLETFLDTNPSPCNIRQKHRPGYDMICMDCGLAMKESDL